MCFTGIVSQHVMSAPSVREMQQKSVDELKFFHFPFSLLLLVPSMVLPSPFIPQSLEPHIPTLRAFYATQDLTLLPYP